MQISQKTGENYKYVINMLPCGMLFKIIISFNQL